MRHLILCFFLPLICMGDDGHGTDLQRALVKGNVDEVRRLFTEEDRDRVFDNGADALTLALEAEKAALLRFLLENGCDPTPLGRRGAMHQAAVRGKKLALRMFLERGADADAPGSGKTPLMLASATGYATSVRMLLKAGGDPNLGTFANRMTAVHFAAANGHVDILKLLIAEGGNPMVLDREGGTSLYRAAQSGQCEVLRYLCSLKLNIDHAALGDVTPLHMSAERGSLDCVTVLVKAGANVNALTRYGYTPLMAAQVKQHEAVATFLRENGAKLVVPLPPGEKAAAIFSYELNSIDTAVDLMLQDGSINLNERITFQRIQDDLQEVEPALVIRSGRDMYGAPYVVTVAGKRANIATETRRRFENGTESAQRALRRYLPQK